jgi:hypothetical protein
MGIASSWTASYFSFTKTILSLVLTNLSHSKRVLDTLTVISINLPLGNLISTGVLATRK